MPSPLPLSVPHHHLLFVQVVNVTTPANYFHVLRRQVWPRLTPPLPPPPYHPPPLITPLPPYPPAP